MLVETAQERNEPIFPALIYSCESRLVPGLSQGPAGSRPRLWGWEQFPETHVETSSAGTMWAGPQFHQWPDGGAAGERLQVSECRLFISAAMMWTVGMASPADAPRSGQETGKLRGMSPPPSSCPPGR